MDKSRKNLRDMSILVLAYTALTLIRLIVEAAFTNFNIRNLPDNVAEGFAMVLRVMLCVISFILLLPQIYIGVKGIKIAKKPDSSKGHLVWAIILSAFAVLSISTPVSNIMQGVNVGANLFELIGLSVDILLFVTYAVCARRVLKAA